MAIIVTGAAGYIGWPTMMRLSIKYPDEKIIGIDNEEKSQWAQEVGVWSAVPLYSMEKRIDTFERIFGQKNLSYRKFDLRNRRKLLDLFIETEPHTIVHLAAQPSGPFSMIDAEHSVFTQMNNVGSTLSLIHCIKDVVPDAHLIETTGMALYGLEITEFYMELTTAGFYGFPDIDAIDWYHLSKVFDSNNMRFAQVVYGLSITDFRIGIVHGTQTEETRKDEKLAASFYFDFWFGTLLNRFCAQAIADYPLTVYGKGGQTRAYISLEDSAEMLSCAVEKKVEGEYNALNAFVDCASVREIAEKIQLAGKNIGMDIAIMTVPNPRVEIEESYTPEDTGLTTIGFKPKDTIDSSLETILKDLADVKVKERIIAKKDKFLPRILREKAKIEKEKS